MSKNISQLIITTASLCLGLALTNNEDECHSNGNANNLA